MIYKNEENNDVRIIINNTGFGFDFFFLDGESLTTGWLAGA